VEDYRKFIEDGWNAYFARDLEACMAFYTEDAEVVLPGSPPIQGKDAIRGAWQMYMTAFPDEHPTQIRHLVDGNTVVTECKTEATHNGPLMLPTGDTLPPTGRKVSNSSVAVQDMEGGKLAKQVFYFNLVELLQQLGVMPTTQGAPAS